MTCTLIVLIDIPATHKTHIVVGFTVLTSDITVTVIVVIDIPTTPRTPLILIFGTLHVVSLFDRAITHLCTFCRLIIFLNKLLYFQEIANDKITQ